MNATIEKTKINFKGREVTACKLVVSSEIPLDINTAWAKVQTSALLVFVAKGMLKFKPVEGKFPEIWKQGVTVKTIMYAYGIIPLGGVHTLNIKKIDSKNNVIQSEEWDNFAKVWNHKISVKKLGNASIHYEDEIMIYGGFLTGFLSLWARSFYKHRQKRWQLVAGNIER